MAENNEVITRFVADDTEIQRTIDDVERRIGQMANTIQSQQVEIATAGAGGPGAAGEDDQQILKDRAEAMRILLRQEERVNADRIKQLKEVEKAEKDAGGAMDRRLRTYLTGTIAVATAGRALEGLTAALVEARDKEMDFADSINMMTRKLTESIPIAGAFFQAGQNIRELFTGEAASLKRLNEEIDLHNKRIDIQLKSYHDQKAALEALDAIAVKVAVDTAMLNAPSDAERARIAASDKERQAIESVNDQEKKLRAEREKSRGEELATAKQESENRQEQIKALQVQIQQMEQAKKMAGFGDVAAGVAFATGGGSAGLDEKKAELKRIEALEESSGATRQSIHDRAEADITAITNQAAQDRIAIMVRTADELETIERESNARREEEARRHQREMSQLRSDVRAGGADSDFEAQLEQVAERYRQAIADAMDDANGNLAGMIERVGLLGIRQGQETAAVVEAAQKDADDAQQHLQDLIDQANKFNPQFAGLEDFGRRFALAGLQTKDPAAERALAEARETAKNTRETADAVKKIAEKVPAATYAP